MARGVLWASNETFLVLGATLRIYSTKPQSLLPAAAKSSPVGAMGEAFARHHKPACINTTCRRTRLHTPHYSSTAALRLNPSVVLIAVASRNINSLQPAVIGW